MDFSAEFGNQYRRLQTKQAEMFLALFEVQDAREKVKALAPLMGIKQEDFDSYGEFWGGIDGYFSENKDTERPSFDGKETGESGTITLSEDWPEISM